MAIAGFRPIAFGKKLAKKDWAIGLAGLAIFIFILSTFIDFGEDSAVDRLFKPHVTTTSDLVDLTLSLVAKERSAYCLDGSLPGYHFQKGSGSGVDSWILHIEGGGWCDSIKSCSFRKTTALGSSDFMDRQVPFSGILSSNANQNPGKNDRVSDVFFRCDAKVYFIWSLNWGTLCNRPLIVTASQQDIGSHDISSSSFKIIYLSFRVKLIISIDVSMIYEHIHWLEMSTPFNRHLN